MDAPNATRFIRISFIGQLCARQTGNLTPDVSVLVTSFSKNYRMKDQKKNERRMDNGQLEILQIGNYGKNLEKKYKR